MIGIEKKLTELVDKLRRTCREDDWWDFKETHYEDRAALLHDIICLANNRANRDAYIILGIRDISNAYSAAALLSAKEGGFQVNIAIPLGGQIRMVICSSFVIAKRKDATHFDLSGESFQLTGVTTEQVYVFDDSVVVAEDMEMTHDLIAQSLPLERFISVSAEEALPNAIGLLLKLAVADGRVTDSELLRIQPALEGRLWQPGLDVKVGDVYTFGAFFWRCLQDHTTQGTWTPDLVPALWRKVEIILENAVRVWAPGIDYIVGDEVAYPDANGMMYTCQQAHTSQTGWEPTAVPSLRQARDASGDDSDESQNEYEV
ncbi:MAG: hypothetical protein Q4E13_05660 [Clostridia bacterium]|nr:hypothetical protein [Clostridia bacterium]